MVKVGLKQSFSVIVSVHDGVIRIFVGPNFLRALLPTTLKQW